MPAAKRFGMQRKIVAAMTGESWRSIPHAVFLYESDVTPLLETLAEINAGRGLGETITLNTAMLKIISEGLKASPGMNAHVRYNRLLARGSVTPYAQINVTLPVLLGRRNGHVTLNLRGVERMSMTEIRDELADLVRRARNSHLPQVMYEVALHDTMKELRRGRVFKALGRLLGSLLDGSRKELLHGEEKRRWKALPPTERLSWQDLEQGTITVSNPGTLFKNLNGGCALLEIVPPQAVAIAVNMVRSTPVVKKDGSIGAAKTVSLTIAFDHRALDGADFVPFCRRIDKLVSSPELIRELV